MANFYYNDVLLPEIPQDVLAEYPHCIIVLTNSTYKLTTSQCKWFKTSADKLQVKKCTNVEFTYNGVDWGTGVYYEGIGNWPVNTLIWSSHDIPNGAETATEIYFYGSDPVPEGGSEPTISYGIESFNTVPTKSVNGNRSLGIRFQVSEERKVVGFRLFSVNKSHSTTTYLWNASKELIASATCERVSGEWSEVYLTEPVMLSANSEYRLVYASGGSYEYWNTNGIVTSDGFTFLGGCECIGENKYPSIDNSVFSAVDVIFEGGSSEPEEPEEPEKPKIYTHTIDFSDPDWATKRSDVFSVTDGSTSFFIDSTLPYNDKPTLRSGAINDGGISETTINFSLVADGSIELNYTVSSENNYDWLRIYVDDTEVIAKSGTVSWTVYRNNLSAGNHTVKFKYTKDGSGSNGSDAGAIGYVTLTGVAKDYDRKYLIQSGDSLFTVTDGVLTTVEGSVNAELFRTYGVDDIPSSDLLVTLTDPVVLYWVDTTEYEITPLVAMVQGVPFTQTIESKDYYMTNDSILGIEKVLVDASDDVRFAISFNSGLAWKMHTGESWATLTESDTGMSASIMSAITTEDWNSEATTGKFRFRITIPSPESYLNSLVVDYLN